MNPTNSEFMDIDRLLKNYRSLAETAMKVAHDHDQENVEIAFQKRPDKDNNPMIQFLLRVARTYSSVPYVIHYDGCLAGLFAVCQYVGGNQAVKTFNNLRSRTEKIMKQNAIKDVEAFNTNQMGKLAQLFDQKQKIGACLYSYELYTEKKYEAIDFMYDHCFSILHSENSWWLVDSFTGKHELEKRRIDPLQFHEALTKFLSLNKQWGEKHSEEYQKIFDVRLETNTDCFTPLIVFDVIPNE